MLRFVLVFFALFNTIDTYAHISCKDDLSPLATHLRYRIHFKSFLDNTEYFKFTVGRTLFGCHFFPSVLFQIDDCANLDVGLMVNHHFGAYQFWRTIRPLVAFLYQSPYWRWIMGIFDVDRYGPRLLPPLLDPAYSLHRPFIEGLCFQARGGRCAISCWIDWLTLWSRKENRAEEFRCYFDAKFNYMPKSTMMQLASPFQWVVYHRGGQAITVNSFSLFCAATGLAFTLKCNHRWVEHIDCFSYWFGHIYDLKQEKRPFKQGWGHLQKWVCAMPLVGVSLSYWYARGFASENIGHPLYQSVALGEHGGKIKQKIRSLLLVSGYKDWEMRYMHIHLAYTPYFDCRAHFWEHAFDLSFSFRALLRPNK